MKNVFIELFLCDGTSSEALVNLKLIIFVAICGLEISLMAR